MSASSNQAKATASPSSSLVQFRRRPLGVRSGLGRLGAAFALVGSLGLVAVTTLSTQSAAATAVGGDEGFRIAVNSADAAAGKPGSASISITPQPGWHLNVNFPTKVSLTAPADVKLPKAKLAKGDAKKLEEKGFEFPVNFTAATAGTKKIDAKLKFAVCTEDACKPVTKSVTISVKVAKPGKSKRSGKGSKKS